MTSCKTNYKNNTARAGRVEDAGLFPKVILLDNTSACNLRCSMCDHKNIKNYRKIQTMSMELYRKLIDEIAVENPSARVWQIFFGEPFLCPDMPTRIAYAKQKGLTDVVLNTNGNLMTPENSRRYIEAGLDAIYVGIDAATEATYRKIRIGGDFNAVTANVSSYRDALQQYGRPGQKLFVQFVVSEWNDNERRAFSEFWSCRGVNVKIRPKISWAGLVPAANLQENRSVVRAPCYWLMQTINICADGRVALCSVDLHCRTPSGDVTNSPIKEVWRNGVLRSYREMHVGGDFSALPSMCRHCADWQSAYADYVEAQ